MSDRRIQAIISRTAEIVSGQLQLADEKESLQGSIYTGRYRALTYALKIGIENITNFNGL